MSTRSTCSMLFFKGMPSIMGAAVLPMALLAAPAGADIYVPDDYVTIQEAVDAADDAVPGLDVVVVRDDVYTGAGNRDIALNKAITVRSEMGAGACIIDCEGMARAFHITADATVEGFTIVNGYTNGEGGATLVDGANPSIMACVFQANTAESDGSGTPLNLFAGNGGAVAYTNGGGGQIDGCSFLGNQAISTVGDPINFPTGDILSGTGGAILVGSGADLLVTSSTFAENASVSAGLLGNGFGGAIGTDLFGAPAITLVIQGCGFTDNWAQIAGGALFLFGGHAVTVEDACSFTGNSAQSGGAIGYQTGTSLAVRDSAFTANYTVADITFITPGAQEQIGGGAVAGGTGTVLTLEGSTFNGNVSMAGRGGAVSTFDEGATTITGCVFTDNEAALAGGAVSNAEAPALATDTDPTGPSTTMMTGCVLVSNRTAGLGGAVANLEGSTLSATGCAFDANTAESPGAGGVQPFLGNGGAVACAGVTVLDGCTLSGNQAIASGDILAGTGGALFVSSGSDTVVGECSFDGNAAVSAGVIGNGFGGAIATDLLNAGPATLTVLGSTFDGNHASIAGGAMFLFGGHTVTVDGSSFHASSAQSGGALAFQGGVGLTVRGCDFVGNSTVGEITFLFAGVQEQIGGGAIGGGEGSTLILEESSFLENASLAGRGGAVSVFNASTAAVTSCEFRGNAAALEGGAVVNQEAPALAALGPTSPSTMTMTNCLVACGTSDAQGGGVANLEGSVLIATNCTIANNEAFGGGGGGLVNVGAFQPVDDMGEPVGDPIPSTAAVTNSIFWKNKGEGKSETDDVDDPDGGATVSWSTIKKWKGAGDHNIKKNPKFVDAKANDCPDGDYRLKDNSKAIDAGSNDAVTVMTDLDGNERIVNGTVDMGAYEFQTPDDDDSHDDDSHDDDSHDDDSNDHTSWS